MKKKKRKEEEGLQCNKKIFCIALQFLLGKKMHSTSGYGQKEAAEGSWDKLS